MWSTQAAVKVGMLCLSFSGIVVCLSRHLYHSVCKFKGGDLVKSWLYLYIALSRRMFNSPSQIVSVDSVSGVECRLDSAAKL